MEEELKEMVEMAIGVTIEMMKNESLTEGLAIFYWNLYVALQDVGFNKEDALNIILNVTIPGSNQK